MFLKCTKKLKQNLEKKYVFQEDISNFTANVFDVNDILETYH